AAPPPSFFLEQPVALRSHRRHHSQRPASRPVGFGPPPPQQPFPTILDGRNRRSWLENAENQPVFVETLDRSFSLDSQPNRTNEVEILGNVQFTGETLPKFR
ncbi:unnamed protein product, partial [Prunus brigantina]